MTILSSQAPSLIPPQSQLNLLFSSLAEKKDLSPKNFDLMQKINELQYAKLIPSKEALLLKNNLASPLVARGVLSDIILALVEEKRLAPEMKELLFSKGLEETLECLYTCLLEQHNSSLKPHIIQQQILSCPPRKLHARMQEAQDMQSKEYVTNWLSALSLKDAASIEALKPLLSPLPSRAFKKHFLALLSALEKSETSPLSLSCLKEIIDLTRSQSDKKLFLSLSRVLKALHFYQKHIQSIQSGDFNDPQLSLCIAADALKNAPLVKKLPLVYSRVYGGIKSAYEELSSGAKKKTLVVLEGSGRDEKAIACSLREKLHTLKMPYYTLTTDQKKSWPTSLVKLAPESLLAAVDYKDGNFCLKMATTLGIPLTFFPPKAQAWQWEEISNSSYPHLRIAFPTPLDLSVLPDEINREKTRLSGIPGNFEPQAPELDLKKKWGFAPESKVIVVNAPEGDSPWPAFLGQEYDASSHLTIATITHPKNQEFIHEIKTKTSLTSKVPVKVFTSLTEQETQELYSLASLIIDTENPESSEPLYRAQSAKTPLLLDHSKPSGLFRFFPFLSSLGSIVFNYKKEPSTLHHEKLLSDHNLGAMIRSKNNFKLCFEELLSQSPTIDTPTYLKKTLPSILTEMKAESKPKTIKRSFIF